MGRKKTAAELRAENRFLRQANSIQSFTSIVNNLFKYGALCFFFYMLYKIIYCLSGQTTHADILISIWGHIKTSTLESVSILFGGTGIAYGYFERKLRQRTIKRLHSRIIEYEKMIDPKRSSSNLSSQGDTHPRDII